MPRTGSRISKSITYAIFFALFLLSGCASLDPGATPPTDTPPDTPTTIVDTTPIEPITVRPLSRQPWNFELPGVAIILTNSQPAYADVAVELAERLESYEVFDLGNDSEPPVSVLRRVNDSNSSVVVAIGLRAARSSVAMADKPVIFSQVFNHQDHALLPPERDAVAAGVDGRERGSSRQPGGDAVKSCCTNCRLAFPTAWKGARSIC